MDVVSGGKEFVESVKKDVSKVLKEKLPKNLSPEVSQSLNELVTHMYIEGCKHGINLSRSIHMDITAGLLKEVQE